MIMGSLRATTHLDMTFYTTQARHQPLIWYVVVTKSLILHALPPSQPRTLFRSLSEPLRELPRITSEAVTATSTAASHVAGELFQEASQQVHATAQHLAHTARTAQPGKALKRLSSKVESKLGDLPEVW